jgi:hypothetical protein
MCQLLVKCAVLILLIHSFRALGRRVGPRYSGLALGLPSTTAAMLVVCGGEHGHQAATRMAEANLLGLVAAVALPLAYAHAVRLGWRLASALLGAVLGYVVIALFLARLSALGVAPRVGLATAVIVVASVLGSRIADPPQSRRRLASSTSVLPSRARAFCLRSLVPALYVLVVALVQTGAGPSTAGLASAFPSMSLVVLAVTHLEAGPTEGSRIARFLPAGNLSTLAFLAVFCWVCPVTGLIGALVAGYAAAVAALLLIDIGIGLFPFSQSAALPTMARILHSRAGGAPWGFAPTAALLRPRLYTYSRLAPRRPARGRSHFAHRDGFSPWVETLGW